MLNKYLFIFHNLYLFLLKLSMQTKGYIKMHRMRSQKQNDTFTVPPDTRCTNICKQIEATSKLGILDRKILKFWKNPMTAPK